MDRQDLRGHIFDADNHLYESRDALTRFLPDAYKSAIQYVDIEGCSRYAVEHRSDSPDYKIPNVVFLK